jgi:lysophospholipase L1-like esterase
MKILVIGDSIGLPHFHCTRDEVEVAYEEVYPELLRRLLRTHFPEEDILLLNQCRHANTSHALRTGAANELLFLRPDVLILQLGLTDLWPAEGRNVPPPVPEFANHDPWVPAERYRENFSHFLNFCSGFSSLSVILVNIPRVSGAQYRRYPVALERTHIYNEILRKLSAHPRVSQIDAFHLFERQGETAYTSDGIHPTAQVSLALANELFQRIATPCDLMHNFNDEVFS